MASLLIVKPVNAQVRCRTLFVPPKYDLYNVEISAALATKLAESYELKSTGIIVNQGSASNQYLSFRYFFQGEPFRYMDVLIGLDQMEILFSNPSTISELTKETGRAMGIVLEALTPVVRGAYFEATLHCEADKRGAQAFFNEMVRAPSGGPGIPKGVAFNMQSGDDLAKLSLEVSDSVRDGLYVVFVFVTTAALSDITSFFGWFNSVLAAYRKLQASASVQILERQVDGSFATSN
jgi:hypothetical protein